MNFLRSDLIDYKYSYLGSSTMYPAAKPHGIEISPVLNYSKMKQETIESNVIEHSTVKNTYAVYSIACFFILNNHISC